MHLSLIDSHSKRFTAVKNLFLASFVPQINIEFKGPSSLKPTGTWRNNVKGIIAAHTEASQSW